jgi:pilus assembly protein Flp/PilA
MFNAINTLIVAAQIRRQEAQGMVEYGLILALVAVVALAAMGPLGHEVSATFSGVSSHLSAGS